MSAAAVATSMIGLFLPMLHDPADSTGDPTVCRCATTALSDGWCAKCRVGYFAGERIESAKVFETLDVHGHEVSADKTECATCKAAIRSGGFCDACRMGYVNGRAFFGRACYHLAKGRKVTPAAVRKPCCSKDIAWCSTCEVGIVGNRAFVEKPDFEAACRYCRVLAMAALEAKRCEHCAMAMIADSRCHLCRIDYKDGARVETPTTAPASQPATRPNGK